MRILNPQGLNGTATGILKGAKFAKLLEIGGISPASGSGGGANILDFSDATQTGTAYFYGVM